MRATDHVLDTVARFFVSESRETAERRRAGHEYAASGPAPPRTDPKPAAKWLVAFSGGPDSTALAWAFGELERRGQIQVRLAHIDHGLDSGSAQRARRARALAENLGLEFRAERLGERAQSGGLSLEAWARKQRYARLHELARQFGSNQIATAHHADDQAETLLLRLAFGSGLAGLAGIKPRHGWIRRPLLEIRRHVLLAALAELGLEAIEDPTNRDFERPRNRIRHFILPEYDNEERRLIDALCRLAKSATRATRRLDSFFSQRLDIEKIPGSGARLDRIALEELPADMTPFVLSTLDRVAGRSLPSPARARSELQKQLRNGDRVGCDAGAGWRWQGDRQSLRLLPPRKPLARFTYTVQVPGSVSVTEIGALLRISGAPTERPEVADQATQAYLRPPSSECHHVVIRNRRPGDRIRPAGRQRERRLKEVLIDQRIPREQRDHIPLVVVENQIAWIPGIALDERFRARDGEPAWLVEIVNTPAGDLTDDKR